MTPEVAITGLGFVTSIGHRRARVVEPSRSARLQSELRRERALVPA